MLRVALGPDVLSIKGAMVAYQGEITFNHEGAGSVGKLIRKIVTNEDVPFMRVAGNGEVFFASEAGFVYLIDLVGDSLSVNGRNLLAFDAAINWDIMRTEGAGMLSAGLYNVVLEGHGTVALQAVGQPVVLDCSQQPTYVDVQAAVAWSANLAPRVVSSMNIKSMLRGGSGEAFQYVFNGPGFVVVQPSEWPAGAQHDDDQRGSGQQRGGLLGGLMG
ncbi:AIM24 family protein [Nakamurella sp. DB0629]|uniref:AIM24 family protein n=2 Tax=Nakamurella aerolata TaxID=1656892 RepID=A0A849A0S5_9ACTN|nr:AIM24 family protein [Nakamurella aerolata]NNG34644.1 AIM24 family protein [Nakamurella aerolata]